MWLLGGGSGAGGTKCSMLTSQSKMEQRIQHNESENSNLHRKWTNETQLKTDFFPPFIPVRTKKGEKSKALKRTGGEWQLEKYNRTSKQEKLYQCLLFLT